MGKLSFKIVFLTAVLAVLSAANSWSQGTGGQTVLPEIATRVELSNSDVNRLVCLERIKDVVFSKEKGITVKFSGRDVFVKFLVEQTAMEKKFITSPTELFVVCGESVYNIIGVPKTIPSQTVRLSSGKQDRIRKNLALFSGMPYEEKLLRIVKSIYSGNLPDSFAVRRVRKKLDIYKDLDITETHEIDIEGEGLRAKEYQAVLRNKDMLEIREKDFLLRELVDRPAALTVDRHTLRTGDMARIIVLEKTEEEPNGGNDERPEK
jgi:conjugal transfer pilus assembly protein TraK